jgi:hypothetical protein
VSNPLKYVTSTPTGTLRHANLGAGVASIQYDETFNSGLNPSNLTTYYLVYEPVNGTAVRIYAPANATELIQLAQSKGSTETTEAGALAWLSDNGYYPANKVLDNVVTDELVLALNAGTITSYPTSGTNWLDLSGEANDGGLDNSPTFDSIGAIEFDGVDDKINIPNSSTNNISDNFTFSILVKSSAWTSGNQEGLVQKGGISNYGAYLRGGGGTVSFYTSTTSYWAPGPNIGGDGKWYCLTFIYSYSGLGYKQIYVNGSYSSQLAVSVPINSNTSDIQIGFAGVGAPKYLNAKVADYKLYNKVLTQAEINQNYYQGSIVTDDLHFAMDASNLVSFEPGTTAAFSLTGSLGAAAGDGVLKNGVDFSNLGNGAWDFDGVDDYIEGPATNSIIGDNLSSITLSAWVQITGTAAAYLFNCKRSAGASTLVGLTANYNSSGGQAAGHLGALVRNSADTVHNWYSNDGDYDNDGIWHNVAFTATSTTNTLYIDGVLISTDSAGMQTVSGNTGTITVGSFGTSSWTNGKIACVKLYTRALTAVEVQQNYNANVKKFT